MRVIVTDDKFDSKIWHTLSVSCGLGFTSVNPLKLHNTQEAGATGTLSYGSGDRPAEPLPRQLGFKHGPARLPDVAPSAVSDNRRMRSEGLGRERWKSVEIHLVTSPQTS